MHPDENNIHILNKIRARLPEGEVVNIQMGKNWTAVVVEAGGARQCGLASNPAPIPEDPSAFISSLISRPAGRSARALTTLATQPGNPAASVGMAAINALLPQPTCYAEENASDLLARLMPGMQSVLVGHFSFVEALKEVNPELVVLELLPRDGDIPAERAPEFLPGAEVVAITSMTLINGTLAGLLKLCSPEATTLIVGPSTPFSPVLFEHGIDVLCGTLVRDIDIVTSGIASGKKIRHLKPNGVQKAIVYSAKFNPPAGFLPGE